MKPYPLIEIFYSLKGEGLWTGTPMLFLRFAGCNLSCEFCDTPSKKAFDLTKKTILDELQKLSKDCRRVVITGGEPNIHNLRELFHFLHDAGYDLHIETNGEHTPFLVSNLDAIDFVTVSPKTLEVSQNALDRCDEIKYVFAPELQYLVAIETIEKRLVINQPKRYILPLAEPYQDGYGRNRTIHKNIQAAIEYCKQNPEFSLCVQLHKFLAIP